MEQSAKHGPALDEQLGHEVDALTHGSPDEGRSEGRRQQAPGPGEPELAVNRRDVGGPDERLLELRSRIAASLRPSEFPTTAAELLATARDNFADEQVLAALESLPGERTYDTVGA